MKPRWSMLSKHLLSKAQSKITIRIYCFSSRKGQELKAGLPSKTYSSTQKRSAWRSIRRARRRWPCRNGIADFRGALGCRTRCRIRCSWRRTSGRWRSHRVNWRAWTWELSTKRMPIWTARAFKVSSERCLHWICPLQSWKHHPHQAKGSAASHQSEKRTQTAIQPYPTWTPALPGSHLSNTIVSRKCPRPSTSVLRGKRNQNQNNQLKKPTTHLLKEEPGENRRWNHDQAWLLKWLKKAQ